MCQKYNRHFFQVKSQQETATSSRNTKNGLFVTNAHENVHVGPVTRARHVCTWQLSVREEVCTLQCRCRGGGRRAPRPGLSSRGRAGTQTPARRTKPMV